MKTKSMLVGLFLAVASSLTAGTELIFSAYLSSERTTRVVLTETSSGKNSGWLAIGERFNGYSIIAFDRKTEVLRVSRGGRVEELALKRESYENLPTPSDAALSFVAGLVISSARPSSATRLVGLIYVHQGDRYHVTAVGQFVSDALGIKVHSVTEDADGFRVLFEERSGALLSRSLPQKG